MNNRKSKAQKFLNETFQEIVIKTTAKHYTVTIGSRIYPLLAKCINSLEPVSSITIITNNRVNQLYGDAIVENISNLGPPVFRIQVPEGESYKNLKEVEKIMTYLIDYGVDRKGLIIGLGGGVIGDLAGFIAATYLRGVRFAQVPTTLLAAVDASIGGKVAVNLSRGKNMIGAFYQPEFILTDVSFIHSLEDRDYYSGIAEVIKHGLIGDSELFNTMLDGVSFIKSRQEKILEYMVERSVRFKGKVVSKDEKEGGLRAILNFGHTIAHAIESVQNYSGLNHGEAVAIGMVSAMFLSHKLYKFSDQEMKNGLRLISQLKLPTWDRDLGIEKVIDHIKYDKKREKANHIFVLLKKIGAPEYGVSVALDDVRAALELQRSKYS